MSEHPILFSTIMVQANLEDRKRMTRRIFKAMPISALDETKKIWFDGGEWIAENQDGGCYQRPIVCPYGKPGDLLWVRETWRKSDFPEHDGIFEFKASMDAPNADWNKGIWKPSIHMPKAAARIWLQIEEIRVERLNEISEEDAIDEGISYIARTSGLCFMDYRIGEHIFPFTAKQSFQTLFLSINGKPKPQREHSDKGKIVSYTGVAWDQNDFDINWAKYHGKYRNKPLEVFINPWVWVVRYKVLSKTGKPKNV